MNIIAKNSLSSLARTIISIPVMFLLIPFTINSIGIENYGLWALTGVIANYQSFVEFGLSRGLVYFVAKSSRNDEKIEIGHYLSTAVVVFCLILGLFMVIVIYNQRVIVENILGIKKEIHIGIKLVILAGFAGAINMISSLFRSVIDGYQRMTVTNYISIVQLFFSTVGTVIVIKSGYGVVGLGYNLVTISLIICLLTFLYIKFILGVNISFFLFSISHLKQMLRYSTNIQISSMLGWLLGPLIKIFVSHFYSLTFVGYMDIVTKITGRITNLLRAMIYPLFPASSKIYKRRGRQGILDLYGKYQFFVVMMSTAIFITILVISSDFIKLWLSAEDEIIHSIFFIAFISSFVSTITVLPYLILMGIGNSGDILKIQLFKLISQIGAIMVSVPILGFVGIYFAVLVSNIIAYVLTNYYYSVRMNVKLNYFGLAKERSLVVIAIIISIYGVTISRLFEISNISELLLFVTTTFAIWMFLLITFKMITKADIIRLLYS